jgi:uncharacterized Zn finger protein (UPF0148 family)
MAVEAQVCPQCGAAVQFGEGQTDVICSHCGTTVVKAAAPGATSVEKELEAEELVQETVRREEKLHSHGRPATGKIVTAQATDIFRQTVEGRAVLLSIAVEVQPDGEPPFAAEAKVLVGLAAVDKYRPGTLLELRYDPQDRAQVSIEGRHGVPSSNPEEQARKQQAEEQAGWQEQQAQRAEPAANAAAAAPVGTLAWWQEQAQRAEQAAPPVTEPATPAWGGPRLEGSVPVPAEFDKVTNLRPAAAVHEHQGDRLLPIFGTPRPNVLVLYRDGLAFRTGKDLHTWRWEEVAVIVSNSSMHSSEHARVWTAYEYTLTKSSGEKVILDDGVKEVEDAIKPIKQAVFGRLLPPLAQGYGAGQAVTFGPVTIHKQNGIQLDGKPYAWNAILDIKVERGRFTVTLRDSKKGQPGGQARVSAIPNIELLGQLIGLKFYETALAYF